MGVEKAADITIGREPFPGELNGGHQLGIVQESTVDIALLDLLTTRCGKLRHRHKVSKPCRQGMLDALQRIPETHQAERTPSLEGAVGGRWSHQLGLDVWRALFLLLALSLGATFCQKPARPK